MHLWPRVSGEMKLCLVLGRSPVESCASTSITCLKESHRATGFQALLTAQRLLWRTLMRSLFPQSVQLKRPRVVTGEGGGGCQQNPPGQKDPPVRANKNVIDLLGHNTFQYTKSRLERRYQEP